MMLLWAAFTFIFLVCGIQGHGHVLKKEPRCNTNACKKLAKDMKDKMDEKVAPCKDFMEYACGALLKDNKRIPYGIEMTYDWSIQLMKDLLEKPVQHICKNSYEEKMKAMYKKCMDTESTKEQKKQAHLCYKKKNWPTLNLNWKSRSFNLQELIQENFHILSSPSLFSVGLVENEKDSERKHILQFSQGISTFIDLPMAKKELANALKQYYVDLAVQLGAIKDLAACHAEDVVEFMFMLKVKDEKVTKIPTTLKDMNFEYAYIDWLEATRKLYKDLKIDVGIGLGQAVKIKSPKFFQNFSYALQKTDVRTVQNFFGFLQAQAKFGSAERFKEILKNVNKGKDIFKDKSVTQSERCVIRINHLYHAGLAKLILKHQQINEEAAEKTVDRAKHIVDDIKIQFLNSMQVQDWMNTSTRDKESMKIRDMTYFLNMPTEDFDDGDLDEYYEDFVTSGMSVTFDYLRQNSIQLRKRKMELLNEPLCDFWNAKSFLTSRISLKKRLDIEMIALIPPLFYSNLPNYLNYATFGYKVALAISYNQSAPDGRLDKDGKLMELVNQTSAYQAYMKKRDCFVKQLSEDKVGQINKTHAEKYLSFELGYSQVYQAYKKYSEEHPKELLLPNFDMSKDQLFFLRTAQGLCGMKADSGLTPRQWINSIMRNRKEFAEAFKCKAGDDMNPQKRCNAWDEQDC